MNGCLFKILIIMVVILTITMGYPHLKKYTSDSIEEKMDQISTSSEIGKKFFKYFNKSKSENDDTKN